MVAPISQAEAVFWADIRKQFYLRPGVTFLNGGSVGPSAKPTIERTIEIMRILESDPLYHQGHTLGPLVEQSREKLAHFVGTHPDRIAFLQNTTMAMNVPAQGLDFEPGSEVLMSNQEYGSVTNVWNYVAKRGGLIVKKVPLPSPPRTPQEVVDAYAEGITPKTRVMIFSHVYCTTGLVAPIQALSQLAREHGAMAIVDGAHAVGMVPMKLDEVGCHFYVNSCHKWLLAPKGVGMLWVSKEYQNKLRPLIVGHGNDKPSPRASKYDMMGTRDHTHFVGLGTAIDFQLEIGWENKIRPYCLGLARYLKERLLEIEGMRLHTSMEPSMSGFMTSFHIEGINNGKILHRIWHDYHIETAGTRISTHFYNNHSDVDRLVDAIKAIMTDPEVAAEGDGRG